MAINVTTSKQQITASVAEDKISATVSGGFGATGPSGVINVTAPITNAGTTTAANVGLSVGTGLSVSGGSLVVTPDTYATLVGGKVPADQLPSYVDDVLEYANLASLPGTGESGKIYVALNTGKIYRWSGSAYFEISTQPGNTDAVPEGSSNLYFTNARARNSFGTGASGQVVRWNGSEWSAGAVPIASASVVGGVRIGSGISIDGSGVISASSAYTLPTATASVLGGVKVGSGVTITDGVISVSTDYAAASDFDQGVKTTDSPRFVRLGLSDPDDEVSEWYVEAIGGVFSIGTRNIGQATGDVWFSVDSSGELLSSTIDWADVTNKPTLFDGAYTSLTSVPSTFAPSAHKTSHATGGSDALTASDIGAAAASHAHNAADLTSGTVAAARLGTGTASSATFLRGDGTWASAGSTSASDLTSGTLDAARLPATTVTAGAYGGASSVATFTVDSAGRLTSAGSTNIAIAAGAVSGLASIATSGSASDLSAGTVPIARLPTGTTSTTVAIGNHTHAASDIASGVLATARLASSGTASATTFLRGDQTWSSIPAGGSTNVWIPASALIPRTTTGPGVDSRETSTNRQNFDEVLFDAGTNEFAQALVVMPSNYNSGTVTARFYWTSSAGSGDVIWGLQGRAFADDDALDTAHGTAQTVADTLLATNDMHVSAATSAITIGGTPAANRPVQFQVYRDAAASGDTIANDCRLLGVEIIYTAA